MQGFLGEAARLFNSAEARVLLLGGNIHDLFPAPDGAYRGLMELMAAQWAVPGRIVLTYEINGPIRFRDGRDRQLVKDAWLRWRHGLDAGDLALARLASQGSRREQVVSQAASFDEQLAAAIGRPTVALELLRQCCQCSRGRVADGSAFLPAELVILVEGSDLILPEAPVAQLGDADRQRLHICLDWFTDPGFAAGADVVVLVAEDRGGVNRRIARLPQLRSLAIGEPDEAARRVYLESAIEDGDWSPSREELDRLAAHSAGLGCQALRQLVAAAAHAGSAPAAEALSARVEAHIQAQLGEDVVGFKRPTHGLDQVVGNSRLLAFLRDALMPRIQAGGEAALAGCAVAGPIGAGKTFIFEAMAGELGLPVLELKNIRSQWFGQTDVVLERLRRVLLSLERVVIIVDEADTQFGGLGANVHETERRLTGRIQAMMSDPALLGRVFWLLMTARIHRLSPDLRRPGRVGDLILPVLDPHDDDRRAFARWAVAPALAEPDEAQLDEILAHCQGHSAAAFAALRRELAASPAGGMAAVRALLADLLPADIAATRRYQTLQALVNCTRRSLLPDPAIDEQTRAAWQSELRRLESQGVS